MRYLIALGLFIQSCGQSPSFKTTPVENSDESAHHAMKPENKSKPAEEVFKKVQNDLEKKADPNLSAFQLTVGTREDLARLSDPVEMIIALDSSNSITRHADRLAKALPPFLGTLDSMGIRMNIRLLVLDEYIALLKKYPEYSAMAPKWFFGKEAKPSLAQAFPSAKLYRSDIPSDVQQLTDKIVEKSKVKSLNETEPMACAVQTFVDLLNSNAEKRVFYLSDEDIDFNYKTFDLAGKLKTVDNIACSETVSSADQVPYKYNIDKSWPLYTYEQVEPASKTYSYAVKIFVPGPCQSLFGVVDESIARFNLSSVIAAELATPIDTCLNLNAPSEWQCSDGVSYSQKGTSNLSGQFICDSRASAVCNYVVDGVPTVESVSIAKARQMVASGAVCNVIGNVTRSLVSAADKDLLGYSSCASLSCAAANYKTVSVAHGTAGNYKDCKPSSVNYAYRSLIKPVMAGNVISRFDELSSSPNETRVTKTLSIRSNVCAQAMPAALPTTVNKSNATASVNSSRIQQVLSATELTNKEIAKKLGVSESYILEAKLSVVEKPERLVTLRSTYSLNPIPSNAKLIKQETVRKPETEAATLWASYDAKYVQTAHVAIHKIYMDSGKYVDAQLEEQARKKWTPRFINSADDLLKAVIRTNFDVLAKLSEASTCSGGLGGAYKTLAEKTSGAQFDICEAEGDAITDFFDRLLKKVVKSVVRDYPLDTYAKNAQIVEIRRGSTGDILKADADFEILTLSDGRTALSFKSDIQEGESFVVTVRLPEN